MAAGNIGETEIGLAGSLLYKSNNVTGGTGGLTGGYPTGGFHDIIVGNNAFVYALPGYDLAIGLRPSLINQLVPDLSN